MRAAFKRLTVVEVDPEQSNQHELNGVTEFRELLGSQRRTFQNVDWLILNDDGDHNYESHDLTWYDARENHASRTEWRCYFTGETQLMPSDLLIVIEVGTSDFRFVGVPAGSSWEAQLLSVFAVEAGADGTVLGQTTAADLILHRDQVNDLLTALGSTSLTHPPSDQEMLAKAIEAFGSEFPTSAEFSQFVRNQIQLNEADPDAILMEWWNTEERLFFGLERHIYQQTVESVLSFEVFLSLSLSIHNRRKSRAGNAFQNHLRAIFDDRAIRYSFNPRTEGRRRPDFLFPGIDDYRDPLFNEEQLTVLAAKTTCKDRWRQILTEAARVDLTHLCTLEPSISPHQITEMHEEQVVLVAPRTIRDTYSVPDDVEVLNLDEFCTLVLSRQS